MRNEADRVESGNSPPEQTELEVAVTAAYTDWKNAVTSARKTSLEFARELGALLIQMKSEIDHGNWLPALQRCGISVRKAQRFMRIAGTKCDTVSHLKTAKEVEQARATPRSFKGMGSEFYQERKATEHAEAIRLAAEGPEYALHNCDVLDAPVADDSVDLILADPPWGREGIECYTKLATFAARVLRPGGLLLAMSGHIYLPEIFARMTAVEGLKYVWTHCYLLPGRIGTPVYRANVVSGWRPLLYFVKGDRPSIQRRDVYSAAEDNTGNKWHKWEQSVGGMLRLIEEFSKPGDLVVSPFLGGGTAVVAALALGRRAIGIDIDPKAIETTKQRLTMTTPTPDPPKPKKPQDKRKFYRVIEGKMETLTFYCMTQKRFNEGWRFFKAQAWEAVGGKPTHAPTVEPEAAS